MEDSDGTAMGTLAEEGVDLVVEAGDDVDHGDSEVALGKA